MSNRCVTCGRSRESHDGQDHKFATMDLPEGYTCADCAHIRFCTGYLGDVAKNTSCDWYPIRFVLPIPVPKPKPAGDAA